jgi:hypothetical protein
MNETKKVNKNILFKSIEKKNSNCNHLEIKTLKQSNSKTKITNYKNIKNLNNEKKK